jgi:hypothetical protein
VRLASQFNGASERREIQKKPAGRGQAFCFSVEAATGFEPVNNGFADRCLSHLAMPPKSMESWNIGTLEYWGREKNSKL